METVVFPYSNWLLVSQLALEKEFSDTNFEIRNYASVLTECFNHRRGTLMMTEAFSRNIGQVSDLKLVLENCFLFCSHTICHVYSNWRLLSWLLHTCKWKEFCAINLSVEDNFLPMFRPML